MEEQYAQVVKALEQELGDRVFLAVTDFHCDLETTIYPFSLTFASRISYTFFIFFFSTTSCTQAETGFQQRVWQLQKESYKTVSESP